MVEGGLKKAKKVSRIIWMAPKQNFFKRRGAECGTDLE